MRKDRISTNCIYIKNMYQLFATIIFLAVLFSLTGCTFDREKSAPEIEGFVYKGNFKNHHYYLSEKEMTWEEADSIIAGLGGHMVTISSEEENNFLLHIIDEVTDAPHNAWIGLSDQKKEGTFTWTNDEALVYTNWNEGEPNDEAFGGCKNDPAENAICSEDYVHIHNSWHPNPGTWNDAPGGYFKWKALLEID